MDGGVKKYAKPTTLFRNAIQNRDSLHYKFSTYPQKPFYWGGGKPPTISKCPLDYPKNVCQTAFEISASEKALVVVLLRWWWEEEGCYVTPFYIAV